VSKGDGHQTGWQSGYDHDQAHRLIHDHGLQGREAKQTDEQRKPELSAPETDQATEDPTPAPVTRTVQDLTLTGAAAAVRVDGPITATR
jgi:hypothetical protein